jgi:hypothetical protein
MVESGSDSARESEFGVKVSIQALKGHPFVILEGSDAKKKFVPAPKKADFDSNISDDEQLIDRNDPSEFMPRSASHTLDREWEYQQSVSKQPQYGRPDVSPLELSILQSSSTDLIPRGCPTIND